MSLTGDRSGALSVPEKAIAIEKIEKIVKRTMTETGIEIGTVKGIEIATAIATVIVAVTAIVTVTATATATVTAIVTAIVTVTVTAIAIATVTGGAAPAHLDENTGIAFKSKW